MPVPSSMSDLSTTASSNSPAGSENPNSTDDYHRAIQAVIRSTNAKGTDIASSTTIDLGAATGEFVDVTGTTTITGLGTVSAGIVRTVRFTSALTLTHNATSLILPTGANITTAANDVAMFRSLGSGNWLCVGYMKADGSALSQTTYAEINGNASEEFVVASDPYDESVWDGNNEVPTKNDVRDELESVKATIPDGITTATPIATTSGTEHDFTSIPSGVKRITVMMSSVSLNGSAEVIVQVGDSGGFVTSGYDAMVGATLTTSNTTRGVITSDGFYTTTASLASYAMNGSLALVLLDGATNTWSCTGAFYGAGGNLVATVAGTVTLSNPLDRIRITSNGADTFDAGTVNIMYEG